MKIIKPFQIVIGTFLICSFLFFSCRVSKTTALKCPQVSAKENNEVLVKYKKNRNTTFKPKYRANIRKEPVRQLISLSRNNHGKDIDVFNNSLVHENVMVSVPAYLNGLTKIEYNKRLTTSISEAVIPLRKNYPARFQTEKAETTDHPIKKIVIPVAGCDTIILKNGKTVPCKVVGVGQGRITYMDCHDAFIPVISISKSKVSIVKYSNSTPVSITASAEKPETTNHPADKIVIPTDRCDTIIFKSGYRVICKVMEIGENILSYRKCDDLSGPLYSISKSDVLEISANNGKKILVNSSFASPYRTDNVKSGSAGFIIGLIGFILFAILFKVHFIGAFPLVISEIPIAPFIIVILLGFTGIMLGIKSLKRIIQHSNYSKEKKFAILSIGVGGFDIILVILLIVILLLTLLIASLF